uniref:Uncharacterized protein n=1 Tax=Odontella aurita TaxID=265563 RepID=A0A6U6HEU4_9STRA|mmetsp:Transcript_47173/g.142844  ORF Transcript_47173/g.142844 Transcript_47173/m.142844 type:complete len:109 (+) Transcript_47173:312-638(+)
MHYSLLLGNKSSGGGIHGWVKSFVHDWGVSKKYLPKMFKLVMDLDFDSMRKERKDKMQTIFNSPGRRAQVFSGLNSYKKNRQRKDRDTPDALQPKQIREEYKAMPEED